MSPADSGTTEADGRAIGGPIDLAGRTALVTGAARRLGRALALALARAGADVAVHCHTSHEEAEDVARAIRDLGRRSALVRADLRDPAETETRFAEAASQIGGLDVLVNNVGTIVWKRIDELDPRDWRDSIDGTLFATLHASRAALPFMRERGFGRIVNILDVDADSFAPAPFATAYKLGKKATWGLTKTLAAAEAPHGITVNAVSPGTLEDSPVKPPLRRMPAGRFGRYEDVASAVLHLVSDEADYVTGTHVKVSGGYLI